MVMIVEMTDNAMALTELQRILKEKGETIHLEIKAQHQDIFNVMHTV